MAEQYLENFLGGVKELEQERKNKIRSARSLHWGCSNQSLL